MHHLWGLVCTVIKLVWSFFSPASHLVQTRSIFVVSWVYHREICGCLESGISEWSSIARRLFLAEESPLHASHVDSRSIAFYSIVHDDFHDNLAFQAS